MVPQTNVTILPTELQNQLTDSLSLSLSHTHTHIKLVKRVHCLDFSSMLKSLSGSGEGPAALNNDQDWESEGPMTVLQRGSNVSTVMYNYILYNYGDAAVQKSQLIVNRTTKHTLSSDTFS